MNRKRPHQYLEFWSHFADCDITSAHLLEAFAVLRKSERLICNSSFVWGL